MSTKYAHNPNFTQPLLQHPGSTTNKRPSSQAPKDNFRFQGCPSQPVNMMIMNNQVAASYDTTALPAESPFNQEDDLQQSSYDNVGPEISKNAGQSNYDEKRYQVQGKAVQNASKSAVGVARTPVSNHQKNHHVQQNAHSLGRDLQGMGLITQVKKGEKVPTILSCGNMNKHQQPSTNAVEDQGGRQSLQYQMQEEGGPQPSLLLKPQKPEFRGRKLLVLDLDETLVHSSFKPPTGREPPADIVLPVDIEGRICNVYVSVRPGCLKFLNEMAKYYEVVIFTASLSKYADPLMDIIDTRNVAPQRLFREHCTFHDQTGVFVKDLSRTGRPMSDVIMIDNSPLSYAFQPENGMPILSWYDDRTDTKLIELIPVLKLLSEVPDVRPVLKACCSRDNVYQTEKSIMMCQRIIEDYKRNQQMNALLNNNGFYQIQHQPEQDQGKEITPKSVANGTNPKTNTWVLGPPQQQQQQNIETSNALGKSQQSPSSALRGKRNHNDVSAMSTQPLNYEKNQFSLTQANSKKNLLLNTTSQTITHSTQVAGGLEPNILLQKLSNTNDGRSVKADTQTTLVQNSTNKDDSMSNLQTSAKRSPGVKKANSSLSKKRPKTANRESSIPKPQQLGTPQRSKGSAHDVTNGKSLAKASLNIGDSNFKKTVSQLMQQQFGKQATPVHDSSSRTRMNISKVGGGSSKKSTTNVIVQGNSNLRGSSQKNSRPATSKNSTRNSTERVSVTDSASFLQQMRASSARKKPTPVINERDLTLLCQQSSDITPGTSKSIVTKATFNSTQGPTIISQIIGTCKGSTQSVRASAQNFSVKQGLLSLETPPAKPSGGSLLSRLVASGLQTPSNGGASCGLTQSTAAGTSQKKGFAASQSAASKLRKSSNAMSPSAKVRDASITDGKSPGKIFATVQSLQPQQMTTQESGSLSTNPPTYSNLMKNLTPQFKNISTTSARNSSVPKQSATPTNIIKGVKLANTSSNTIGNTYLANKFNQTLAQLGQHFSSHHPPVHAHSMFQPLNATPLPTNVGGQTNNLDNSSGSVMNYSATSTIQQTSTNINNDSQIHSMLNEFEKTKNLNKELLLMRNIGSPKQPGCNAPLAAKQQQ